MIIFSHRGLGFGKEENSLESYEEALKQGFSLEIDVQMSKDGKLIISHDVNLKRQKNLGKNVTDLNFKELIELMIPSFEQVLNCFKKNAKNKQFMAIHIKDEMQTNIIEEVIKTLRYEELVKECFVFDLTTNGAKHAKQLCPDLRIGLSIGEKKYTGTIYLFEEIKDDLNADIVWWDEWNSGLYNEENALKIKESGKLNFAISPELHKVHGHPKGDNLEEIKKVWRELIKWKVDGICTDFPLELREFLTIQQYIYPL